MKSQENSLNVKSVDRKSPTQVKLSLEYSGEKVKAVANATANRYLQSAKIPGFRPGKAPLAMVRQKYGAEIQKDVLNALVQGGMSEALEQTKLVPINQPNLTLTEASLEGDKPFAFEVEFEVEPEIELSSYKKVPLKLEPVEVSDEDVQKAVDNIRERMAVLEPLEGEKPVKGAFAVLEVSFEVTGDPTKKQDPHNVTVEVGDDKLLPEIEAALPEMAVGGEAKTVVSTFPADYGDKDFAGKEATFTLKVLELKKKVLPEVTDAWAAQLKADATVLSLRAEIRQELATSKKEQSLKEQRSQIVEYLIKNNKFDVPPSLVERQKEKLLQFMIEDLKKRGQEIPSIQEEERKLVSRRAEEMVRSSLLLREIATKEQITVDEGRVQARIDELATQINQPSEKAREMLAQRGMLDRIRDEVVTDQVFEFLIQNAELVGGAPRP